MDHVQRCSVLSVVSCSKHLVPKVKFHDLARHAATKTVPEGTGARRGAGRGERVLGGSPFPLLLRALRVLCAKKILATMRDADGLQCRERGEKVLPKMQTSPTLQCRVARAASEFGPMANAHHFLVGRITEDKFLFASSYLSAFALKFFCLTAWMRLRA
jgi:hypothetical protein